MFLTFNTWQEVIGNLHNADRNKKKSSKEFTVIPSHNLPSTLSHQKLQLTSHPSVFQCFLPPFGIWFISSLVLNYLPYLMSCRRKKKEWLLTPLFINRPQNIFRMRLRSPLVWLIIATFTGTFWRPAVKLAQIIIAGCPCHTGRNTVTAQWEHYPGGNIMRHATYIKTEFPSSTDSLPDRIWRTPGIGCLSVLNPSVESLSVRKWNASCSVFPLQRPRALSQCEPQDCSPVSSNYQETSQHRLTAKRSRRSCNNMNLMTIYGLLFRCISECD